MKGIGLGNMKVAGDLGKSTGSATNRIIIRMCSYDYEREKTVTASIESSSWHFTLYRGAEKWGSNRLVGDLWDKGS